MKTVFIVLLMALSADKMFSTENPEHMLTFNGKDLDGWKMTGTGRFIVDDGMLRTEGGQVLLFYAFPQYAGAGHFHVEFKVAGNGDAGILIRMKEPSASSAGVRTGYKIRIASDGDKWHCTGAIEGLSPARACLQKPNGEWNTADIWIGAYVTVLVNGTEVNSIPQGDENGRFYGLENHDAGSLVYFRSAMFRPNFN
ncbi:MAG TPA: DUF1080 domain-containing protein [Bryobacteraceae bacterium]|nr:DUF1080 domain-containing protein [Bryobacteraceae bacterium]